MDQRLPDEYFRPAAESDDVTDGSTPRPGSAGVKTVSLNKMHDGLAPRIVVVIALVALGVSFTLGRLWLSGPPAAAPTVAPSPTATATPTVSPSPEAFAPYEGAVVSVRPVAAEGTCLDGGRSAGAQALIDGDESTIWRCGGVGVGETATFSFPAPRTLAGLRLVNGNTVWTGRYLTERRITGIRWTFDDGSFFEQGLAANDRSSQEVRFPETVTDSVTFTILSTTIPGDSSLSADAVSISSLDFLGPA